MGRLGSLGAAEHSPCPGCRSPVAAPGVEVGTGCRVSSLVGQPGELRSLSRPNLAVMVGHSAPPWSAGRGLRMRTAIAGALKGDEYEESTC